jgi:hypothetical protein
VRYAILGLDQCHCLFVADQHIGQAVQQASDVFEILGIMVEAGLRHLPVPHLATQEVHVPGARRDHAEGLLVALLVLPFVAVFGERVLTELAQWIMRSSTMSRLPDGQEHNTTRVGQNDERQSQEEQTYMEVGSRTRVLHQVIQGKLQALIEFHKRLQPLVPQSS